MLEDYTNSTLVTFPKTSTSWSPWQYGRRARVPKRKSVATQNSLQGKQCKARLKRRILHAPNRIAELSACKMRRLNQLNATYFNSMRVSRIFDWSSRIYDWSSTVGLNAVFYIRWTVITTFRCLLFVSLVVPEAISVWMALILTFLPFYGLPRRLRGRLEGA